MISASLVLAGSSVGEFGSIVLVSLFFSSSGSGTGSTATGAALLTAGLLSVVIYPPLALALLGDRE